jgi:hypothetical protein
MTVDLEAVRKLEEQLREDATLVLAGFRSLTSEELKTTADTLRDLRAEVCRLYTLAIEQGERAFLAERERDAALARVKELEAEVAAMRPVVEAVETWSVRMPNSFAGIVPAGLRGAVDAYRARKP